MRGLVIEMPVLDNALTGVAGFFTPIMLGLRFGAAACSSSPRGSPRLIPRTHYLSTWASTCVRQRPGPSLAVLEGLLLGETAPHREERRRIEQPALIVGHTRDPVHPFSDSGMLAEELENATLIEANSILEWRLTPGRLDNELSDFLDRVWELEKLTAAATPAARRRAADSRSGPGHDSGPSSPRSRRGWRRSW